MTPRTTNGCSGRKSPCASLATKFSAGEVIVTDAHRAAPFAAGNEVMSEKPPQAVFPMD
jgi:hypothetical protein